MIIGRKTELASLERAFASQEAQFVTIYGRRRVGKTFLIRTFFKSKQCIFLHVTGLQKGTQKEQLINFTQALSDVFNQGNPLKTPANWREALEMLTKYLAATKEKVILFFDELPWMATRRSGLMQRIDYNWNNKWAWMPHVIFVACGSSASWLLTNIIYNKGGFHNRTTLEIHLLPFDLVESKQYLQSKGINVSDRHIITLYMAIGGIPYYLNYALPGKSAQENIQFLYFEKKAPLIGEYEKLFVSLFDGAEAYKEIISIVSQKREGVSRDELVERATLSTEGGYLSKRLKELSDAGFIKEFIPFGKKIGEYYKVIDEFCLFYLRWVKGRDFFQPDYWLTESHEPEYFAWSGYAFEAVCVKHYRQIINTLGIRGIDRIGSWRYVPRDLSEKGTQIDLVIDRHDDTMTLCEIKYTDKPFVIDKAYAAAIEEKMNIFKSRTKTNKQLFFCMISANGIKETVYSKKLISSVVTLEDLFN